MPQDRKTNINNLTIVWQGQSWSVIAPNGSVLGRYQDKWDAVQFAKNNTRYIVSNQEPKNYVDNDFIEFRDYIYEPLNRSSSEAYVSNKPKNDVVNGSQFAQLSRSKLVLGLKVVTIIIIGIIVMGVLIKSVSMISSIQISDIQVNWLGIGVLGVVVVIMLGILKAFFEEGCLTGMFAVFVLVIFGALCNLFGILGAFLNWVF